MEPPLKFGAFRGLIILKLMSIGSSQPFFKIPYWHEMWEFFHNRQLMQPKEHQNLGNCESLSCYILKTIINDVKLLLTLRSMEKKVPSRHHSISGGYFYALFTERSYKINLQFFLYDQVEQLYFRKFFFNILEILC